MKYAVLFSIDISRKDGRKLERVRFYDVVCLFNKAAFGLGLPLRRTQKLKAGSLPTSASASK